jgi:hypothetical protein
MSARHGARLVTHPFDLQGWFGNDLSDLPYLVVLDEPEPGTDMAAAIHCYKEFTLKPAELHGS